MGQMDDDSAKQIKRLERKLAREMAARAEAERLLEEKSSELYDLTRRTQDLSADLQRAERESALILLAEAIAHDLNNLITAISGYAILLQNDVESGTKAHERALRIERASSQAASVLGSLDQLTTQNMSIAPIDLTALINTNIQIADGLRPANIRFHREIDEGLILASQDMAISRGLINIIKNAFEAIDINGRVTLRAARALKLGTQNYKYILSLGEPEDDYATVIEISDNGRGMDESTLTDAFKRSFSTKSGIGLTGLGLQSVKYLADQNLAFITVESQHKIGSRFCLYLKNMVPAASKPAALAPKKAAEPGSGAIFIIDDDPLVGDMLQETLQLKGHNALWYEYPLQALKDISNIPPALIITDFNMPEMSGREFAEQAHTLAPHVPIIVYSGQAASIPPNPLYAAILKKPITADKLDQLIKKLTTA